MTPDGHIDTQDWMTAAPTRAVLAALTADGAVARFVGGRRALPDPGDACLL